MSEWVLAFLERLEFLAREQAKEKNPYGDYKRDAGRKLERMADRIWREFLKSEGGES